MLEERASVPGFVDLHSHWVAGVDDGARTPDDGLALLRALRSAGFDRVIATPHMRPSMFPNTKGDLERAFAAMQPHLAGDAGLPEVGLASEHFFDDVVFERLLHGDGLPYPGGRAVLVEFPERQIPLRVADRFFDLRRRGLRPVLAHPERYAPVWDDPSVLEPLFDGGAVMLLDVAALAGKYGRAPRRAAEKLLDGGFYDAACSDAHRAADIEQVVDGIERLQALVGRPEADELLREGPLAILAGTLED